MAGRERESGKGIGLRKKKRERSVRVETRGGSVFFSFFLTVMYPRKILLSMHVLFLLHLALN